MNAKWSPSKTSIFFILLLSVFIISCNGQKKTSASESTTHPSNTNAKDTLVKPPPPINQEAFVPLVYSSDNEQISRFVRRIFQDSKGHLWFGTNGDGIIRYAEGKLQYFSINEGFGGVAVRGILEDKEGIVWFATNGGLTKYDGNTFVNFTEKNGLANNDIWSLAIDTKGIMWIGTLGGMSQFDGNTFTPFIIPESDSDPTRGVSSPELVTAIMQDSKGSMWFGTSGGAFIYDGKSISNLSEKDGLANNSVNSILEDRDGNIWFATHYEGISRFDGTSFTNFTADGIIKGGEVWSIYEDKNGDVWFPAENHGVYRYDGKSFTNYGTEDGLTTNAILCFYRDKEGRFWLGGWKGLFRYDNNSFVSIKKKGPWEK